MTTHKNSYEDCTKTQKKIYVGDSVYAEFDGSTIELTAPHTHSNSIYITAKNLNDLNYWVNTGNRKV